MKISESTPVVRMAKFTGLAPSRPRAASHMRRIKGTAQLSTTIDLAKRLTFMPVSFNRNSSPHRHRGHREERNRRKQKRAPQNTLITVYTAAFLLVSSFPYCFLCV